MVARSSEDGLHIVWTAQATFLQLPETKRRELREGHFTCFDFQKTFHSRDVF